MNLILILIAAANCALLVTPDDRAYCRALQQNNPARCVEIADEGVRRRCRVALGDDESACQTLPIAQREHCKLEHR